MKMLEISRSCIRNLLQSNEFNRLTNTRRKVNKEALFIVQSCLGITPENAS